MQNGIDKASLDQWYVLDTEAVIPVGRSQNRLLGTDLTVVRQADGAIEVFAEGRAEPLPLRHRFGFLWATLGEPEREIFPLPEADEPDRRYVPCGVVTVKASGLRIVENFLDMAHFPFVHTDVLGAEPHTEVQSYDVEIRRDEDEVWATNCTFFQPRIAATESSGDFVHLTYRVPSPFVVMLYRVCPTAPDRLDAIALFIQPMEEDLCRAQPVMYLVDKTSTHTALLNFEQVIFLQDRIIVENQRPLLLPLEPRAEIPTRADSSSIAYRRWLKEKGIRFGTTMGAA